MEQRGIAAELGVGEIEPPAEIAAIRPLDLDDARAEIAEPQRSKGAGQELAHVEDQYALEQPRARVRTAHGLNLAEVKALGVAIFDGLQMLAIEHELALVFEHFVGRSDQAHLLVFRPLIHVGADRVDRVADEHRLDEAQLVVAVGEGVDAVGRDEAEPGREHEGAGDQPLAETCPRVSAKIWSAT